MGGYPRTLFVQADVPLSGGLDRGVSVYPVVRYLEMVEYDADGRIVDVEMDWLGQDFIGDEHRFRWVAWTPDMPTGTTGARRLAGF